MEDGLLFLTGGLSREVGIPPSSDAAMKEVLWQSMMEWWMSAHVIGCEHRIDRCAIRAGLLCCSHIA